MSNQRQLATCDSGSSLVSPVLLTIPLPLASTKPSRSAMKTRKGRHKAKARPVPVLPPELLSLVFQHLTSPLSLSHPPHYSDLLSFSLVCRSWAPVAQRLLSREVFLSRGDEQMQQWLFQPQKARGVETLVVHETRWWEVDGPTGGYAWSAELLLKVFERCRSAKRVSCNVPLYEVCEVEPAFLYKCLPNVAAVAFASPYRDATPRPLPPHITSFGLLTTDNPTSRTDLSSSFHADFHASLFPSFRTLVLHDPKNLDALFPLFPRISSLEIDETRLVPSARGFMSIGYVYHDVLRRFASLEVLKLSRLSCEILPDNLPVTLKQLSITSYSSGKGEKTPGVFRAQVGRLEVLERLSFARPPQGLGEGGALLQKYCSDNGVELEWI
ncbi:hypothetical protein JCM8547_008365 [Rhodosporidiobolus lusitaniae]